MNTKLKWLVSTSSVACVLFFTGCNNSNDKACSDYTTEDDCTGKTDKDGNLPMEQHRLCR